MATDRTYYHVTSAADLDRIRDEGLVPSGEWACLGPDPDPEDAEGMLRVWLCDRRSSARRYEDLFGKTGPTVILAVPGHALTDVEADEAMDGDFYVLHAIVPEDIQVLNTDGSLEPLAPFPPMP